MEKIFAYGSAEEQEKEQQKRKKAQSNLYGSPEHAEQENGIFDKILGKKKRELDVTEIPLANGLGKLKVGVKIEEPKEEEKDNKSKASFKLGDAQRDFFKQTADVALGKAEVTVIEFCPDWQLKVGLDLFKVDSTGDFEMLQASIAMPVRVLSKEQVKNTPLKDFAAQMSDKAELYVEIQLVIDLSRGEAKALRRLKIKQGEVDAVGGEVDNLDKKVKQLKEQKLKSKESFIDSKLEELGKKSKDELSDKELKKLERQFNKTCEELRDEIVDTKNKLRKQQQNLKKLQQKSRDLASKIKSPLLKKLNSAFLKKIGSILSKLATALNYIEVVYSVLKILILLWSGAKIKFLKGESLDDISPMETSELLMQVMHDKITGKKQAENPEYTDKIEEYGTGGGATDDDVSAIQAELQNFISAHGKAFESSGTKTGNGLGGENGTGSEEGSESEESKGSGSIGKASENAEKEAEEQVKKQGVKVGSGEKAIEGGEKSEVTVYEEKGEKVEAKRIKIVHTADNEDFDGEHRVIGNKKIKLNKESVTHGDNVEFSFSFTAYFKGELCEFQLRRLSARVHIDAPVEGKAQCVRLILSESVTCYFEGGKLCIKKGNAINYTQIEK